LKTGQRPYTVALFEVVAIVVVLLSVALAEKGWLDFAWSALLLFLILCITRFRSRAARWIYTGVSVLAGAALAYGIAQGMLRASDLGPLDWLFIATAPIELALLWATPTSQWMKAKASARQTAPI
jgi:hypothetical protein